MKTKLGLMLRALALPNSRLQIYNCTHNTYSEFGLELGLRLGIRFSSLSSKMLGHRQATAHMRPDKGLGLGQDWDQDQGQGLQYYLQIILGYTQLTAHIISNQSLDQVLDQGYGSQDCDNMHAPLTLEHIKPSSNPKCRSQRFCSKS